MAIHTKDAIEVAEEIFQTLKSNGLIGSSEQQEAAVIAALSGLLVEAGFPDRDVLSKNITILLSDIRGFSEISETYSPRNVVTLLNRYFDCMGEIITRYGGHIDKLMGDSILALFGIPDAHPDNASNAIACAVEMQIAMTGLNERSKALGMPALYMGIALNTGSVVVGDLGSKHYNEYTVIGDEVNLTSRIEAHCLRGQILISENTYRLTQQHIEVGDPNMIEVKGARKAVNLYELFATSKPKNLAVPRREGRKSPRIQVNSMPVVFQRLNGKIVLEDKYEGEVIDISYNGLRVSTDAQLTKSSEIKMTLSLDLFGKRTTDVYARIIRSEPAPTGDKYLSNIEFTTIGDEGQRTIKQYVDQLVAGT